MLDLDAKRTGVPPRDAATLVVVRDGADGVEVFCVERHAKSGFLGGAVVFPGGKVDPDDASTEWEAAIDPDARSLDDRPQRIAACREALEEAAILPVSGGALAHEELLDVRARALSNERSIRDFLVGRALRLDLAALHPFARWVTPAAESRRYDTRFFLTHLPAGQSGAHDDRETTSSFWATPTAILSRFREGRVQLLPPTHRTLEILAEATSSQDAVVRSAQMCLDPICPLLTPQGGTMALVLPGDPAHELREARIPGKSRYVLRGDRWLPEDAPGA